MVGSWSIWSIVRYMPVISEVNDALFFVAAGLTLCSTHIPLLDLVTDLLSYHCRCSMEHPSCTVSQVCHPNCVSWLVERWPTIMCLGCSMHWTYLEILWLIIWSPPKLLSNYFCLPIAVVTPWKPGKKCSHNCWWSEMIWGFPKIGVPLNHPFIDGFALINHPFLGTPIYGNHHIYIIYIEYLQ